MPTVAGTPLSVLLVEDDPNDAELVEAALVAHGFQVRCSRVDDAPNFDAGLAQRPDIILCDYGLPQFSAEAALTKLKSSGQDVPLIVVSGSIGDEAAVNLIKHGADDYLLKDRLARLGAAVDSSLNAQRLRAETRRAEEDLRQSEVKYRSLFEWLPDAACLAVRGRVIDVNPRGESLFGLERSQILGKSLDRFVPTETFDVLTHLDESTYTAHTTVRAGEAERPVMLTARTFPLYDRRLLLSLFRPE